MHSHRDSARLNCSIIYEVSNIEVLQCMNRTTSILSGSLASSIFDPYTILVGASGGVYAMFTAHLANVILVSLNLIL